ncbi:MAG: PEP-CTERM sorting domain-containing protein [Planctomycetota bacterium]
MTAAMADEVFFPDFILTPGTYNDDTSLDRRYAGVNTVGGPLIAEFGSFRLDGSPDPTISVSTGDTLVITFRPEPGNRFVLDSPGLFALNFGTTGTTQSNVIKGNADVTLDDPDLEAIVIGHTRPGGTPSDKPFTRDFLGDTSTSTVPFASVFVSGRTNESDELRVNFSTALGGSAMSLNGPNEPIEFDAIEIRRTIGNGIGTDLSNPFFPLPIDLGPQTWEIGTDIDFLRFYTQKQGQDGGLSVVPIVPEPATGALAATVLGGLTLRRRRSPNPSK